MEQGHRGFNRAADPDRHEPAATPLLLADVRRRAAREPSLSPRGPQSCWDADTEASAITLELALGRTAPVRASGDWPAPACRARGPGSHLAHARDPPRRGLHLPDVLRALHDPAQEHDAVLGIYADRPFGGLPLAKAWVANAVERDLIAKTGASNESTRYSIMAAGRNAAGVRTGRFVLSQKARDSDPSRQF